MTETSHSDIAAAVKAYILMEFLPGEDPSALADDTELISTGVLDSLATLRLVGFLEERFAIELAAHEAGVDYLNTIRDIAKLVEAKQAS